MHHYPDSSYEARNRSEQRSVVYRGHPPDQYYPTGPGYGGSAHYGMSRETRETSFVNQGYRRKPPSIQSIEQHPNDRWDHPYHRGNPQEIELPDMGNPSFRRPYVGSPSSYKMDRTQERTRSREMMKKAYANEGFVHTPPSLQTNDQYPMNTFDYSHHRGSRQATEQPGMANPSNHRILVMPPSSPTMDGAREGTSNKKRKMKRESIRIILTRVCSAVFIIADCVFDWMQYTDMTTPPEFFADIESNFLRFPKTDKHCTSKDDVAEKYMYFTIAGTVLTVIQLANIIFQIYSEVKYMKEKTGAGDDNDSNQKKPMDKIMKYPKKLLDGRTETLYSVLFIEIPQGLLLLRYQNVCLPSCAKTLSSKTVTRRTKNIVNGGIAILNNAFRYVTCTKTIEESVEDDTSCCGGGGKCVGFLRCLFKCACPCLCCFHRYVYFKSQIL
ncbi:Hypothetical predicted protein [Mytilus galloprovincialis]|uniref:Uncharacterized protein n=1 Tax=Mytilus galloprovincialis TaxID=29158 RepID=A0A8B6GWP8_MYTGA|nr:Hypothetical predicted protein [Mytilus galloprovincialis]